MPRKRRGRYERRPRYGGEYDPEDLSPRDVRQIERRLQRAEQHALAREVELALSNYRWAHSLTQQQLAERLGVKQPQVARLESGVVTPSLDTLARISERLGIEFTIEVKSDGVTASANPPGGTTRPGNRPA